ncbi:MAG: hypothetical protein ACKOX6_06200 [Bdellovibrio sp.]
MKSSLLILPLLMLSLAACQPQTTSNPAPQGTEETQNRPLSGGGHVGGVDSGGDNGVNGRNMEDYAINLQRDKIFNDLVLPIILKVSEANPRFASDMIHITKERTWYMIPVALKNLTASQIGLRFADEQVQQFALQNLRAIWINQKFYTGFETDESRGRLILHEILMGVRLMKLKNSLDNCYSEIAMMSLDSSKKDEYKKRRELCAITYMFGNKDVSASRIPGLNGDLKLTDHDYDSIRELGVRLWDSQGEIGNAELEAWLKANDFRTY